MEQEKDEKALVDELKELLQQNVAEAKEKVEALKVQFYREYHERQAQAKRAAEEAAAAAGEALENWQPVLDEAEQQFRELLNEYKAKRAEAAKQLAAEQEQNLQAEWKTIGPVPAPKANEIWKQYQQYQEQFYDLVKINIELRDLDFKKNLELKTLLCEAAEKLKDNENIVEASRALQQLHDEWAEIGPVAREIREELWNRFKEASSIINKKHQAYFDAMHAKEAENLEQKRGLIEQLKAIDVAELKSNKQWEKASEQVQQIQAEWRKIGFAPKKQNQAIYDEYRNLCDAFFKAKTAYFKDLRDVLGENLKHKRQLLAKAEELSNSEEWNEASAAIIALQKEWKTVGPIARKYSDELWNKFTAACDSFFEKRRAAAKSAKAADRKAKVARTIAAGDRNKLMRMHENLVQEIKTAENNILFFTGKSKSANKLVDDLQKKIDALKKQLSELEDKITAMDEE